MPETWPVTVPHKPRHGTPRVTPFRAPEKTDMEGGNSRQRRSVTKNIATMAFEITMDAAEFADFKAFVRDTLVDGTVRFTMPVWTFAGYADRICQFTEPYSATPFGAGAVVSVSIDIEDY